MKAKFLSWRLIRIRRFLTMETISTAKTTTMGLLLIWLKLTAGTTWNLMLPIWKILYELILVMFCLLSMIITALSAVPGVRSFISENGFSKERWAGRRKRTACVELCGFGHKPYILLHVDIYLTSKKNFCVSSAVFALLLVNLHFTNHIIK